MRNSRNRCKFFFTSYSKEKELLDQRGLTEFTTTWVAEAGPHPQEQEGDFSHWHHHRAMLQSEEGGLWAAVQAQNHLPTSQRGQEGLRERGTLPGEELPRFLTKTVLRFPTKFDHWLVRFPLYYEATGNVRNGIPIRRKSIWGKDPSTLRPTPSAHIYTGVAAAAAERWPQTHSLGTSHALACSRPSTDGPQRNTSCYLCPCVVPPRSPWVCDDLVTCFS